MLLRRPFLVSLVALFPFGLALWYMGIVLWGGLLLGADLLRGAGRPDLPADIGAASFMTLGVGFVVVVMGVSTARGLRQGAAWSRFATPLLALFAFPPGYPYDLAAAGAAALLLFLLPGPRGFFGRRA